MPVMLVPNLSVNMKVVQKSEKELSDAFRQLLSCLPTSRQCARWFTESAFHGGKSGHNLYKVRMKKIYPLPYFSMTSALVQKLTC